MASVELKERSLVVHIHGWDKLLALRSTLTVPLAHVTAVRAHPPEARFDDTVTAPYLGVGTLVRGTVAAGSMVCADGRAFYDVHDPAKCIAIDLDAREKYHHIVIQIDDEAPEETVRRIELACGEPH